MKSRPSPTDNEVLEAQKEHMTLFMRSITHAQAITSCQERRLETQADRPVARSFGHLPATGARS